MNFHRCKAAIGSDQPRRVDTTEMAVTYLAENKTTKTNYDAMFPHGCGYLSTELNSNPWICLTLSNFSLMQKSVVIRGDRLSDPDILHPGVASLRSGGC